MNREPDTLLADPESAIATAFAAETEASRDTAIADARESGVDVERGTLSLGDGIRYATRETLGSGGMGTVDLSADRLIGRDVAVKTLRPQLADDPRVIRRFLREARIQGQLEHPAIVPVYDLGRTEDGALYFAMKRVKGRTLREILAAKGAGQLGRRRLLAAFSRVCQAVAFAHARGVVHRDLKPDNLMLGEHGEVYVLDWGIARVLGRDPRGLGEGDDGDAPERIDLEPGDDQTRHGAIIGTVGYMAPEQASGEHERIDARSDVWSLGAILFELLCGRPLVASGSATAMLAATILGVDGDPSAHDPEVPPELASVCVAATATDPAQRLASAAALSEAIERYLDGDRDTQMRKRKAEDHAIAAAEAAAAAFVADDLDLRQAAARESATALALDPGNLSARRTLLELLTRPPAQLPEGARARIDEEQRQTLRSFYRESVVAVAVYTPVLLVMLLVLDLREAWILPVAGLAGLAYVVLCVIGMRDPQPRSLLPLSMHACISVAMLALARVVSPLVVLPSLAVMNTMVTLGYRAGAPRWAFVAVGVIPVLGAGLLELAGIWPATMTFADGALILHSAVGDFDGGPGLLAVLLGMSVVPLIVGTPLVGRVQQLADEIARAAQVQRWQLEQLLPRD